MYEAGRKKEEERRRGRADERQMMMHLAPGTENMFPICRPLFCCVFYALSIIIEPSSILLAFSCS